MKNTMPKIFVNRNFSLSITPEIKRTYIQMRLKTKVVNTRFIPKARDILEKSFPRVLESKCFNDRKLSFYDEVINTEIGHLFEHILIENLCQLKIAGGAQSAIFNGLTNWNWNKDPRGLFHIRVDAGIKDYPIFSPAMNKSIELLNLIIGSTRVN